MTPYTTAQICDMRQRRITTKSNYKMTCGCCGDTIHRGDKITQMLGSIMRMRPRAVSGRVPPLAKTVGCAPYAHVPTGNSWVHLNCRPQYFKDWGNGSIGYFPHPTAYSQSLEERMAIASNDPDWGEDIWDIPHPKWKWQKERLAAAIIPLQQNWRRKEKQRKCEKSVINATKILDNAAAEIIVFTIVFKYEARWEKALLNHMWKIIRGELMPGTFPLPPLPRNVSRQEMNANIAWGNKILQAAWYIDSVNRYKEHYWEKALMNKIINVNILTGKPRTPLI